MEFEKFEAYCNGIKFIMQEDLPDVGVYLLVYENGKLKHDYLQDSIELCKEFALEEFNVPMDIWNAWKDCSSNNS